LLDRGAVEVFHLWNRGSVNWWILSANAALLALVAGTMAFLWRCNRAGRYIATTPEGIETRVRSTWKLIRWAEVQHVTKTNYGVAIETSSEGTVKIHGILHDQDIDDFIAETEAYTV